MNATNMKADVLSGLQSYRDNFNAGNYNTNANQSQHSERYSLPWYHTNANREPTIVAMVKDKLRDKRRKHNKVTFLISFTPIFD